MLELCDGQSFNKCVQQFCYNTEMSKSRLLSNKVPEPHKFKTLEIEKLNNELKKHIHYYSSLEELNIILENYRKFLMSFDVDVDDDYKVIMHFLNGLGIYHNYGKVWKLFFEPLNK